MDLLKAHGIGEAPIRATSQLILTPGTQDIIKPNGNYTKGFKVPGEPNLVAANLVAGKSYFGVQGGATINSLGGKKFQNGSGYYHGQAPSLITLPFVPAAIYVLHVSSQYLFFDCEVLGASIRGRYVLSSGEIDGISYMGAYINGSAIEPHGEIWHENDMFNYIAYE